MEGESIVSRARTAFHSATAKAEQALIDFKSDLRDSNDQYKKSAGIRFRNVSPSEVEQKGSNDTKQLRWKPPTIGIKQEWHTKLRSIGKGRNRTEGTEKVESPKMSFPVYDENIYRYNETKGLETSQDGFDAAKNDVIPPSSVLKQLGVAVESGKNYQSVKDLLTSSTSSSPVRERASLSISAVKSLVLRGKEEKIDSQFGDCEIWSFIQAILDAEGLTPTRKVGFLVEKITGTITLAREVHGAPQESLIVKVSEVIGSLKTLRMMALFWSRLVAELRRLWLEERYVPGIPLDEIPDLNFCLLHQQMQLMNGCTSRKKRRAIATKSLESLIRAAGCDADGVPSSIDKIMSGSFPYAQTSTGDLVVRLGASHQAENLAMLETDEPIYAPFPQEGPLVTEDLAREAEEFVLRTRSVGAGCSQLLSDMQAFKAANPGCILEDFVRWHSPPDWTESESRIDSDVGSGDSTSSRGRLSSRMKKEGNLWRELWDTAKPVPAVNQTPLFDEDLAVEGVLRTLEEISPYELFGQLFRSYLGLGFMIAETKLSTDDNIAKLFYECKDYAVALCQGEAWKDKIDDICQAYETVEAIFLRPEDIMRMTRQPEDTNSQQEEPKHRLKKFTQIFGRKNRPENSTFEEQKNLEDSPNRKSFSNFFDSKSSLFSKKPPKNTSAPVKEPLNSDESECTVV